MTNVLGIMRDQNDNPLHPFCKACGWRKGGIDSWDGRRCKCGHSEPPMRELTVIEFPQAPQRKVQ